MTFARWRFEIAVELFAIVLQIMFEKLSIVDNNIFRGFIMRDGIITISCKVWSRCGVSWFKKAYSRQTDRETRAPTHRHTEKSSIMYKITGN